MNGNEQYGEFVSVANAHAAKILEDTPDAYTCETPEYLAPTGEITGGAEVENDTSYFDGVPMFNYVSEGATPLQMRFSNVPARKVAYYTGKDYDEASGRVLDSGTPEPPYFAVAFEFEMGMGEKRYYQYLKGTFSAGPEEAASRTTTVDKRNFEMMFTAIKTTHKWPVNGKIKGMKRIYADTTDAAFTGADAWYSQVQTPETAMPPAALALSGSAPVDDATNVPVGGVVTLTFNNKLAAQAVLLLNESGNIVPVTKAYDATGKILTITPAANLAADTLHFVVLSGVKDIYGQSLAETTLAFTTA